MSEDNDYIDLLEQLVRTLVENDPSEPIADNGMTVLDGWRERARRVLLLAEGRPALRRRDADGEPVAWRVKNEYGYWHVTQSRELADTYQYIEKLDCQPLYTRPTPEPVEPREALIEQCAKIAEPWPGFPTTDPNTYGVKLTEADKAVIAVRTEIAQKIRALAHAGDSGEADAKAYAEDWQRQIINAGGDENVAQQAVALAALNGLFDHLASPQSSAAHGRDEIARIIDPEAFEEDDLGCYRFVEYLPRRAEANRKAREILALPTPPASQDGHPECPCKPGRCIYPECTCGIDAPAVTRAERGTPQNIGED